MSGPSGSPRRPPTAQVVVAVAVGAAAIALVVTVTVGVLGDGAGTGHPGDFFRALGRELTDPTNWRTVGLAAALGAVVTVLVRLLAGRGSP